LSLGVAICGNTLRASRHTHICTRSGVYCMSNEHVLIGIPGGLTVHFPAVGKSFVRVAKLRLTSRPNLPTLTPNNFSLAVHLLRACICQIYGGLPVRHAHIAFYHRPLGMVCLLSYARLAMRPQLLTRLSSCLSYTPP